MKETVIKIAKVLVLAIAIEAVCVAIGSTFLIDFLTGNIIVILITLMAINTATSSFIVSKLQEIGKDKKQSFTPVYREIKKSLSQQIFLLVLALVVLVISGSSDIKGMIMPQYIKGITCIKDIVLIFSFVAAIEILRDTGVAMFDILIELEKNDKK